MTVIKLDKKTRDALPPEMFAFPRTRRCPLNDQHHTMLAWAMVDGVQDASADERREARQAILARAAALAIETKDWHKVKSMSIECMSLEISDSEHPNKMPFSGVLTKLDELSDAPPHGSGGRLVIVSTEAARRALSSLLGMSVNFTPSFDGHDPKAKIGIITSADIVGNEVRIEGFVYASDFPETAALIQELKSVLGFSFEAQRIYVEDPSADVLRITELTFTGAAILLKDKGAFKSTSLAASAENGDLNMTAEELKALMGPLFDTALKPITDRLTLVEGANTTIVASIEAGNAIRNKVEPHAAALEAQATAMDTAGLTGVATGLRKAAADMRAEAAAGRLPSNLTVAAPVVVPTAPVEMATQITAAVEAALKPVKDELAATKTQLADAVAGKRLSASAPDRKTVAPQVSALMNKAAIAMPEGEAKLAVGTVDALMAAASLNMTQKIMVKNELGRLGVLA